MKRSPRSGYVRFAPTRLVHSTPLAALFCCGALGRDWHEASVRCDAPIRSLSDVKRTWRAHRERVDATRLTLKRHSGGNARSEQTLNCPASGDLRLSSRLPSSHATCDNSRARVGPHVARVAKAGRTPVVCL